MALYVYGLMRSADGACAVQEAPGDGPALEAVRYGGLCALTSQLPDGNVSLRRDTALAHSRTLQSAFEHGPVLPVRFGTVVEDAGALEREVLAPQAAALMARLDALEGSVEMQVKATYAEEPLLRSILASMPHLAQYAARIRDLPAAAAHFDQIALGEAINAAVQSRREADCQRLVEALSGLALAVSVSEPTHERTVANAAFLVRHEKLPEFDAAVEQFSERHRQEMQFRLIGPMPAHSFADHAWERELAGTRGSQWG